MRNALTLFNRGNLSPFFRDMDRVLEEVFATPTGVATRSEAAWMPATDVEETDTHYLVTMDVPGVKKEEVNVELNGKNLTVKAERKSEKEDSGTGYRVTERFYGKWERSFVLPANVDGEKIEASYVDGVLKISIPKAEAGKPKLVKIH